MKNYCLLVLFALLIGCAGSPTRTAMDAERNRMDMIDIRKGMSMAEVQDLMGVPKKVERRSMDGIEYEIWYYMTTGVNLDQTRLIDENFTPFIFYGTCLRGWGWQFYNILFDINNARFKNEQNSGAGCYKKIETAPNEQIIVEPSQAKEAEEKSIEETLRKLIESGKEKNEPIKEEQAPSPTPPPEPPKEVSQPPTQPPPSNQKLESIEGSPASPGSIPPQPNPDLPNPLPKKTEYPVSPPAKQAEERSSNSSPLW